ncbi:MAG: polysaccharide pyruvyl transferase family protein [Puniceicoccales bacterium]|jgi:exopolysaccharide biosynthesis predicted pyruvyltransferase EpsI|nr:polysaccharide pyruvyl transferase family protein [Puniceicoccales bacterium]
MDVNIKKIGVSETLIGKENTMIGDEEGKSKQAVAAEGLPTIKGMPGDANQFSMKKNSCPERALSERSAGTADGDEKNLVNLTFNFKHFSPFLMDNSVLLEELHGLPSPFTYVPNPGNTGDMLIAKSTIDFFDAKGLEYKMFDGKPADFIVYGGGGIWLSAYRGSWLKWLNLFKSAKKVIILPSSFWNCDELINVLDERFVVFCREEKSYKYLLDGKTKAKIILDHDMAFRCSKNALCNKITATEQDKAAFAHVLDKVEKIKGSKVAYFMRTDCESAKHFGTDLDLSSCMHGSEFTTKERMSSGAAVMLSTVDNFDVIVTDRLHVAIASALMGKQVYMLDNSYGKLSGVYKHSMYHLPNVRLCDEIPKNIGNNCYSRLEEKPKASTGKPSERKRFELKSKRLARKA